MTLSITVLGISMATWSQDVQKAPCGAVKNLVPGNLNRTSFYWDQSNMTERNTLSTINTQHTNSKAISGIKTASISQPGTASHKDSILTSADIFDRTYINEIASSNGTETSKSTIQSSPTRWVVLVALMSYIAGYAVGFGPGNIIYIYM